MVMAKSSTVSKDQALTLLNGFLQQFQVSCNKTGAPKSADFEKFLGRNCKFWSNGKVVSNNLNEYLEHITKFQQKYSHIEISRRLVEEPVISENKAVFLYNVHLKKRAGGDAQMYIMAVANITENKITQWTQVAYEEGTGSWDQ